MQTTPAARLTEDHDVKRPEINISVEERKGFWEKERKGLCD